MTLVKICGITSVEDARACIALGADMLGFVFAESPRQVDMKTVMRIQKQIAGRVPTVGVFTAATGEVLAIADACRLDFIQLHGGQSEAFAARVGARRVIRAIRVRNRSSLETAAMFENAAYYLLDTYSKNKPGGTGMAWDWSLLPQLGELPRPMLLSGGLTPESVQAAIAAARPHGVDASSGVEISPGKKDLDKVERFIRNVRDYDNRTR